MRCGEAGFQVFSREVKSDAMTGLQLLHESSVRRGEDVAVLFHPHGFSFFNPRAAGGLHFTSNFFSRKQDSFLNAKINEKH